MHGFKKIINCVNFNGKINIFYENNLLIIVNEVVKWDEIQ